MSCCLESCPSPEPAASHSKAERTLSPPTLDLPPTLPETSAPKALLVTAAQAPFACLPELCFIYLFFWEAEQASDGAHRRQLGFFFFLPFFTREGERQTSWGICPLRESLSCSPSRHAPLRRE